MQKKRNDLRAKVRPAFDGGQRAWIDRLVQRIGQFVVEKTDMNIRMARRSQRWREAQSSRFRSPLVECIDHVRQNLGQQRADLSMRRARPSRQMIEQEQHVIQIADVQQCLDEVQQLIVGFLERGTSTSVEAAARR